MQYQGAITNVGKYTTGNNQRGPWSVQHVTLKSGNTNHDITVWGKPDLSQVKGLRATIEGVEWGTDKQDKRVLELRGKDGTITISRDTPTTSAPQQAGSAPSSDDGIPTQAQYEGVLGHAIQFVGREFEQLSTAETDFRAVAEVVKGYMVAFAKGDFRVVKTAPPAAPVVQSAPVGQGQARPDQINEDIPF